MNDGMDSAVGAERMMAVLAVFFAGCALLVTAIVLYGTLAYATARIFIGSFMGLLAIESSASVLPAIRAALLEPIAAIRCE